MPHTHYSKPVSKATRKRNAAKHKAPIGRVPESGRQPSKRTPMKATSPRKRIGKTPPKKGPIKGTLPVQPSAARQRLAQRKRLQARVDKYGWKGYQKRFAAGNERKKKPSWLADGDSTFPSPKKPGAPRRKFSGRKPISKAPRANKRVRRGGTA